MSGMEIRLYVAASYEDAGVETENVKMSYYVPDAFLSRAIYDHYQVISSERHIMS